MNVPEQPSIIGPGKAIVTEGKELNFVCGKRNGKTTCSITLNMKGPRGPEWIRLEPATKRMHFRATGADAAALFPQIFTDQGKFEFTSVDGKFFLSVHEDHFEIRYDEHGL